MPYFIVVLEFCSFTLLVRTIHKIHLITSSRRGALEIMVEHYDGRVTIKSPKWCRLCLLTPQPGTDIVYMYTKMDCSVYSGKKCKPTSLDD